MRCGRGRKAAACGKYWIARSQNLQLEISVNRNVLVQEGDWYLHQVHPIIDSHVFGECWVIMNVRDAPLRRRVVFKGAAVECQKLGCIETLVLIQEPHDISCDKISL